GLRRDELAELFSRMGPEATSSATDVVRAARDLSQGDLDRGLARLHHAGASLAADVSDAATDVPGPAAARLSCALLEALAARLAGSPLQAERAAEAAEELRQAVPAHLLGQHPELMALLLTHLGSTRLWVGRFEDARTALSAAAGCPGGASTALVREESLGHLALIDYLNGWHGRAERKALAATTDSERFGLCGASGPDIGRMVLAAVAVDRNELDHAQALLDEAPGSRLSARDPVPATGRSLVTARLLLARGKTRAALAALDPTVSTEVTSPWAQAQAALVASAVHLAEGRPDAAAEVLRQVPDDQPACAVEAARAQLAAGRPAAALDLLDRLRAEGPAGPAVTVRATLTRAQVALEAGDSAAAGKLVGQALLEARRERLRRPFLEAGPWIRRLLGTAPLQPLAAGWLTTGDAPRLETPAPLVVQELSERERDVLRRLAQMMSTEEIAADLCVSVNTVKTHLKSVYRKLAVNRRNEAVRRARELRLL
ncbi:LuxR C-terminal-related transcriptional regulator, partial [Streptomyces sp. NPDC127044]